MNGLVERANRTLADTIAKIAKETNRLWDKCIPDALFAMRTTYQSTTQQTPFYLTYGREARRPIDNKIGNGTTSLSTWTHAEWKRIYQIQEELIPKCQEAQQLIIEKQQQYKARNDDQIRWATWFHIGDPILLYRDYAKNSFSNKLDDKWDGPFYIEEIIGPTTYYIHNGLKKLKNPVHANRTKHYYNRSLEKEKTNAPIED